MRLKGRTTRTALLQFLVVTGLARLALGFYFLDRVRKRLSGGDPEAVDAFWPVLGWIDLALSFAFLWLAARRFQDQDRPGWLALVPTAAALALGYAPLPPGLASTIALLVLVAFVFLLVMPGTIGPNPYGPDPRGWRSREHYLEEKGKGCAN